MILFDASEIVSLIGEAAASLAKGVVVGHIRAVLTQRAGVVQRAIPVTCSRLPEIEGAETALQRWTSSEAFIGFFERVHAGERGFDDEVVASFIDEGGFYFPTEEECQTHAREIIAAFIGELAGAFYRSDEGLLALANRQEALHLETRSGITQDMAVRFDALEAKFSALTAPTVALAGSTVPGMLPDSAHHDLAVKIDFARGLINRDLVRSARVELERLKDEAEAAPEELKFRILTNLGACALADEDIDSARALLEEAHRLQPESQKGIANAALAAQLGKDPARAMKLAVKARELDPRDPQATAVLIEELWKTGESEQLEELVTAEEWIELDQQCSLVLARIRVQQSRYEEAVALCRSLAEADAEDSVAHLALSQCLLTYAQANRLPVGHMDESLARLREAEAVASRAIELLRPTELKARYREAVLARAVARALLGKSTEAMGDLTEVLSEAPTHPDAAFNKGLLLLSEGRPVEARAVFEGLQDSGRRADAALPLAHACIAAGDEAAAVQLLRGALTLEHPGWEDVRRAELLSKAEAAVGDEDSVGPAIEAALAQHSDDPRLLALAAIRCEILGDPEGSEDSLLDALMHAGESDRQEVLVRLGTHYHALGRYAEAADQFVEVVDEVPWHPAAIPLLMCLVNSKRLREALGWARRIREAHPQPPRVVIEVEAQILDQVGDVRAALQCRKILCARADATSVDQVTLALTQFRYGERDAALETILRISASELSHDPRSVLVLAKLKLLLGVAGDLDDAYLARRYGVNDPAVHLGYIGLFLDHDKEWVEPETVGPGCAVLLKSESTELWWQILDDGEASLGPHELRPSDDLAQQLAGQRVGDIIVLREGLEDLSYEIAAVQSKFVRAFQETNAEFSTRFPGDMGLYRVKVVDDDFTKVFLSVDRRDQFVRQAERMYQQGRLAFSSFSSLLGRSVLEVWRGCTENDSIRIRFGTGTAEEAGEASSLLGEADGVVLDLLALLTVHELGLAAHLRSRFPRAAVPQHVIDELQNAHALTVMGPAPTGSLGKSSDGRYTLTEMSEANWTEWQEFVRSVLEFAESFERIASYRMLNADNVEGLVDALTSAGVGAVYAGDEQSAARLILVSDDLGLSSFARSLGVGSVNTQAILDELLRSDTITSEAYSSGVEQLVLLNYWFVQVRSEDIVRRLEASDYMTTCGTRAMLQTLEGPDCSEDSAVSVGAGVITALAGRAPREQTELLLMVVLATLRHGREMSLVLLKFRNEIASRLAPAPATRDQLLRTVDLYTHIVNRT